MIENTCYFCGEEKPCMRGLRHIQVDWENQRDVESRIDACINCLKGLRVEVDLSAVLGPE